jgi:hypothetical protein
MPDERRQFRVLYRDFLFRLVDIELLSAGGDVQKLLGQFVAMLAAFGFTIAIFTFPALAKSRLPFEKLIGPVRIEQEFLIATTMAIAGLFSVLAWNAVFPDRRDSLILGLLPVRIRTIFLAKVAAIATALGVSIAAVNTFTGLCFPFLAVPPNAGLLGGLRSLGAHWLTMTAAGLFVCCSLLALQGLAAHLLSYRLLLRVSSFLQLAAFFVTLGVYFLKPTFTSAAGPLHWLPSFWFCGLLQVLNGASDPGFRTLALRALWGLLLVFSVAAATLALAYRRNIRRIIEQPDIAPADRSRPATRIGSFLAAKLLARPIERAIMLFTARTIARSRQHRLLLAAYGGIGLAIALAYVKDLVYYYAGGLWDSLGVNREASAHWNQANVPLLAGSLVLLYFLVIGARATFSMPIALPANWIFRVTAVHSPADCFAAVRRALLVLIAIPMWIAAGFLFFSIWPAAQALEHVAILVVIGILLVEISLYRFRKIPFACSYLPGKANINVRLGVYGLLFLFAADRGVAIEYWAIGHFVGFVVLFGVLLCAALWARRRTAGFANLRGNHIQFEDVQTSQVFALDLRQDGSWSSDEASANAVDPHYGRKLAEWAAGSDPKAATPLIALNIAGNIAQSPGTVPLAAMPDTPPMPVHSVLGRTKH